MKLGCLTVMFGDKSLKQTLDILRPFGLQAIIAVHGCLRSRAGRTGSHVFR